MAGGTAGATVIPTPVGPVPGVIVAPAAAASTGSGVATAVATAIVTVVGGFRPRRPARRPVSQPVSLAGALTIRFGTDPAMVAASPEFYQSEAGDKANFPYVIFTLKTGPTGRTTSTTLVKNIQVTFEAYAETIEQADAIAEQVSATFKNAPLQWAGGFFALPLVPSNRMQAAERARGKGGVRPYRALVSFLARCHEPR